MTSEQIENYTPSLTERLRVATEYVQIGAFILLFLVFFIAPMNILRGEVEEPWLWVPGIIGMLFWAYAASVFVQHWPF